MTYQSMLRGGMADGDKALAGKLSTDDPELLNLALGLREGV
jgi:hypothetical protein